MEGVRSSFSTPDKNKEGQDQEGYEENWKRDTDVIYFA